MCLQFQSCDKKFNGFFLVMLSECTFSFSIVIESLCDRKLNVFLPVMLSGYIFSFSILIESLGDRSCIFFTCYVVRVYFQFQYFD